jgi:hypothetical protein
MRGFSLSGRTWARSETESVEPRFLSNGYLYSNQRNAQRYLAVPYSFLCKSLHICVSGKLQRLDSHTVKLWPLKCMTINNQPHGCVADSYVQEE